MTWSANRIVSEEWELIQHMVGDQPRIMFLHYWGIAPAADLAKGLRAALDQTKE